MRLVHSRTEKQFWVTWTHDEIQPIQIGDLMPYVRFKNNPFNLYIYIYTLMTRPNDFLAQLTWWNEVNIRYITNIIRIIWKLNLVPPILFEVLLVTALLS